MHIHRIHHIYIHAASVMHWFRAWQMVSIFTSILIFISSLKNYLPWYIRLLDCKEELAPLLLKKKKKKKKGRLNLCINDVYDRPTTRESLHEGCRTWNVQYMITSPRAWIWGGSSKPKACVFNESLGLDEICWHNLSKNHADKIRANKMLFWF